jgi:hypothetical protein
MEPTENLNRLPFDVTWHIVPIQPHPYNDKITRVFHAEDNQDHINDANAPQGGWFVVSGKVRHFSEVVIDGKTVKKELKELEKPITLNADGKPDPFTKIVPMFPVTIEGKTYNLTDFQYIMFIKATVADGSILAAQIATKDVRDPQTGLSNIDLKCNYNAPDA